MTHEILQQVFGGHVGIPVDVHSGQYAPLLTAIRLLGGQPLPATYQATSNDGEGGDVWGSLQQPRYLAQSLTYREVQELTASSESLAAQGTSLKLPTARKQTSHFLLYSGNTSLRVQDRNFNSFCTAPHREMMPHSQSLHLMNCLPVMACSSASRATVGAVCPPAGSLINAAPTNEALHFQKDRHFHFMQLQMIIFCSQGQTPRFSANNTGQEDESTTARHWSLC
jgi:hypothetical protein